MPTPAPQGFPPVLGVPSLYRILRSLPVDGGLTTFDLSAEPVGDDVVAEVQALYPSATANEIRQAAVIKQVDVQNSGYDTAGAAQTVTVNYFEHLSGGIIPGPDPANAKSALPPGTSASYPSPMRRGMERFYLQCSTVPPVAQVVNVIVWFDVPGFGS